MPYLASFKRFLEELGAPVRQAPSSMLVATKRVYVDNVNSQLQADRAGVLCTVRLTWDGGGLTFDAAQDVALRFKKGENVDIEIRLPIEN